MGKCSILKDFVLFGTGLILIDNFLEKRNLNKYRVILVGNDLIFYTKKLIYCANVFKLMYITLIHHEVVL